MKWIVFMALNLVGQFYIHPDLNLGLSSPFLNNRTVKTYWNDVTLGFEVKLYDSAGTEVAAPTTGPTVQVGNYSLISRLQCFTKFYKYCVGNDLHEFHPKTGFDFGRAFNDQTGEYYWIGFISTFPYAEKQVTANHWSCNIHVCSIEFDLTYTTVTADSGVVDGAIAVKANSSGGDVRFTRDPNAGYNTAIPSVSGVYTFTSLAAGTYTIYTIDQYGCKASIVVNVPTATSVYNTRWRLQYYDLFGRHTQVDVEAREQTPVLINGSFINTLSPSTSEGSGNAWTWTGAFSGAAQNVLPSSMAPTQRLRMPFAAKAGIAYTFEISFSSTDEGGGPGNYTDVKAYLTDGLDFSNYAIEANLPLGTEVFNLAITATHDRPYLEITAEANNTIAYLRSVLVLKVKFIGSTAPAITQVIGATKTPLSLQWSAMGEVNIFTPIGGSLATIDLLSETDLMFFDLFTQDERKYRVKQYKDTGSGLQLKWMGYVLPMAYSEPYYTDKNYPVQIIANDQIGNLKDLAFTDDSGNVLAGNISFLDAICMILRKTDINLDVRESVNIFETTMDQDPEDSALQQAYFDTSVYIGKNCEEVLTSILTNWGARVYQAEGYWNVELIEQRGSASIAHRIFNINGQYKSNGTHGAVSQIKKATDTTRSVLRDRSGLITMIPSFGNLKFTVKTNFNSNLLTRGSFERTDLQNTQLIGWTFDMTNATGVSYGIEDFDKPRGESTSALFIDFGNVTTEKEIIIKAESFNLEAVNGSNITLKFDVLFRPIYKEIFSYIDVSLKIGDQWMVQSAFIATDDSTLLLDGEYNRYYVDSALEWKTIEKKIPTSSTSFNIQLSGPVILKIRVNNNVTYDYASITALRAQVTDDAVDPSVYRNLTRVRVKDSNLLRLYTLNSGTSADNSPEIIRPNDYNGTTNKQFWKLDKTVKLPAEEYLLAGLLIDNVVLSLDSNYPDDVVVEKEINENIKPTLPLELLHCDLAISELSTVSGTANTLRMSKSFIRKNNGAPTVLWARKYETEARTLLDILLKMYQAQVTSPSFKLNGSFYTDVYPSYFNSFYEARLNKYLLPISLNIRDAECSLDAELIELRTGDNGEPPTPDTYEFTDEHTTEFDS